MAECESHCDRECCKNFFDTRYVKQDYCHAHTDELQKMQIDIGSIKTMIKVIIGIAGLCGTPIAALCVKLLFN